MFIKRRELRNAVGGLAGFVVLKKGDEEGKCGEI